MSVEETELLGTVGGIVGRVQINSNALTLFPRRRAWRSITTSASSSSHAEEFFRRWSIFKARKCRLGTQTLTIDRIAVEQEFLDGIVGQGVSVIAVGISGSNSVDPLSEKITAAMDDLSRLSAVADTPGEALGERQLIIDRLQKNGTTIRAAVGLIKRNGDGFEKIFSKKNRLYGNLSHQRASVCVCYLIGLKYLYADWGSLCLDSRIIRASNGGIISLFLIDFTCIWRGNRSSRSE